MTAYKGFNPDMTCRGFQYEVGKTYEHEGKVKACESGFHACENPLDVLGFYPPANDGGLNRYCEVEQSGAIDNGDDKIASPRIRIAAEIGLDGLIKAGVKFILDRVKWGEDKKENKGDRSAATVEGSESIAIVTGYKCKAKGALGCWLVLTERDDEGHILCVQTAKVDGESIKPDTFYMLNEGKFTEVK